MSALEFLQNFHKVVGVVIGLEICQRGICLHLIFSYSHLLHHHVAKAVFVFMIKAYVALSAQE